MKGQPLTAEELHASAIYLLRLSETLNVLYVAASDGKPVGGPIALLSDYVDTLATDLQNMADRIREPGEVQT